MPITRAQMGEQIRNAPKSKPRKVKLTRTQLSLAKRLGITPERMKAAKCRNGLARKGKTRGRMV